MSEEGVSVKVLVGIGAGLGFVGYVIYREKETKEMKELNERNKKEVLGRLASAVQGEMEGKNPSAENVAEALDDAEYLKIPEDEEVIQKSLGLLRRTLDTELKMCISKTARAAGGEKGLVAYHDGSKLKDKINLAKNCNYLYRGRFWFITKRNPRYDKELLKEAKGTLVNITKGKQPGQRQALMTALPYLPSYLVSLGMGVIQFQLDHQVFQLLPELVEIDSREGMAGVRRHTINILAMVGTSRML